MFLFAALACNGDAISDDTASASSSDPAPPPLAELSSNSCPDLSESGTGTFTSSDMERRVTTILPEDVGSGAPVIFFFHGLMDGGYGYSGPGEYMANALDLQSMANDSGAIIVLPDSELIDLGIMSAYMWDIDVPEGADIVLYDDLRTCLAEFVDVDLTRISAFGFSGGALFVTKVLSLRGDELSTAVEASGGSEAEIPLFSDPVPAYVDPGEGLPVLLISGGDNDVWPDPSIVIVDFDAASDNLEQGLVDDGHFVVRCEHDRGHTLTNQGWNLAKDWLAVHVWNEDSPYATDGVGDDDDWCEVVL